MRFEARKDKQMIIPVVIGLLFGLFAITLSVIDIFSRPFNQEAFILLGSLGFFILTLLFIMDAMRRVYYELQEEALFIRFGIFKQTIEYEAITEVKESRSFLSSFAWTFDRIAIYKSGKLSVLIGPLEKARFLKEIERKINPLSIDF
jgi:hypothetical protein